MYEMKTLLPQFDIQLPTSMYEMKNVTSVFPAAGATHGGVAAGAAQTNGDIDNKFAPLPHTATSTLPAQHCATTPTSNTTSTAAYSAAPTKATTIKHHLRPTCALDLDILGAQIQQVLKSTCNTNAIVLRQDKVLQQLLELKQQMAAIRATLGLCQKGPQHTGAAGSAANNGGLREEPLQDIVINGHPGFIPYALLALKNAWRNLYTIDVKTFTHSTMADVGPEVRAFEEKLKAVSVDASKPKINVSLIWKNCEHTEMISSPTMYVPIYGEVNILRYLGRVGPEEYRYENSPLVNEIDAVLDICYQLLRCTTAKDRAKMFRALGDRLQQQPYFGGEQLSIADIGVHSSLKRLPVVVDKELTPALREWRKRAQQVTLI